MRHDFYNVVSCITFVNNALIDVFIVMFEWEWFKIIFLKDRVLIYRSASDNWRVVWHRTPMHVNQQRVFVLSTSIVGHDLLAYIHSLMCGIDEIATADSFLNFKSFRYKWLIMLFVVGLFKSEWTSLLLP